MSICRIQFFRSSFSLSKKLLILWNSTLKRLNAFHFIVILIIPTTMNLKQFIHLNKSSLLKLLLVIIVLVAIFIGVKKISSHSLVIGHPSEIIVISPENSQDVIVIGDPDKVNVKPKKR